MDPDSGQDHMFDCAIGYWAGIGDDWSNATSTCVNLEAAQGCDCGAACDAGEDQANGWRNAVQISRFLWDLIDSNDEGTDDTDLSMADMVALFEGMPCVGDYRSVDGSCEEQAPVPPATCNPDEATDGGAPRSGPSRDSFNCFDIAELVPGSQTGERTLNCVQDAPD
jgi:hypothetical protein